MTVEKAMEIYKEHGLAFYKDGDMKVFVPVVEKRKKAAV